MQIYFALSTGSAPASSSEQLTEDRFSQEKQIEDKYSRGSRDKQLNESLDSTIVTKKPDIT
jgi:hypothetical protein